MTIRTRTLASPRVALLALLLAAGAALTPSARGHGARAEFAPESRVALALAVADQGNRALKSIRADARAAIRAWEAPALPAPDMALAASASDDAV